MSSHNFFCDRSAPNETVAYKELQEDYYNLLDFTLDLIQANDIGDMTEARERVRATVDEAERRMRRRGVPPRRNRSLQTERNRARVRKSDSMGKMQEDECVDSSPESSTLVAELNYTKVINQLIHSPAARASALLLQALRQQVSISSSHAYSTSAIAVYASKDVLSLKNRKHSVVATLLLATDHGPEAKEQLGRFLNTLASFKSGRNYLLSIGQGKELLSQITTVMRTRKVYGHALDHLIGTLQKLSIRPSVQRELLQLNTFEWLLNYVDARPSPYGLEYACALLLNLCLNPGASPVVSRSVESLATALLNLLKGNYSNSNVCPYLNGILYTVLSLGKMRARAKEHGFEQAIQAKIERSCCSQCDLQLPYILRLLKGEIEPTRNPYSQSAPIPDDEDSLSDIAETEVDATDSLRPLGGELSGARLLIVKVLGSAPSASSDDREEPSGNVPGTVPRRSAPAEKGAKRGRGAPRAEEAPARLQTAQSMVTFVVESERRRPLTGPTGLNEAAAAYRVAQQALQREREEKERLEREKADKERAQREKEEREKEEKERRARERQEKLEAKREMRRHPSSGRQPLKVEPRTPTRTPTTARKGVKIPTPPIDSPSSPSKSPPKEAAKENMIRPTRLEKVDKAKEWEADTPVEDSRPNRIPDDADPLDYVSVFGSRPKVTRTPDKERKPVTSVY